MFLRLNYTKVQSQYIFIDIDINKEILKNINIDKEILKNIDID